MIFQNYVPNSRVPVFLEFLVNVLSTTSHSKSAKYTCKNHIASPENFLYLFLRLIWLLIAFVSRYNILSCLKCFWSKFTVVICCLHAVVAHFKTNIHSKYICFLATTVEKWVISGLGLTEIVNPCKQVTMINLSSPGVH